MSIEPGNYETVDGLNATVQEWSKTSGVWTGYVEDYPTEGEVYFVQWLDSGEEATGMSELDLDID